MPDGHVRDAHIMHRIRRATSTGRICSQSNQARQHDIQTVPVSKLACISWAEAPVKIARMTLTIKLDGNWSSFQLANSAPPLSVTDSAIAPSARMGRARHRARQEHRHTLGQVLVVARGRAHPPTGVVASIEPCTAAECAIAALSGEPRHCAHGPAAVCRAPRRVVPRAASQAKATAVGPKPA